MPLYLNRINDRPYVPYVCVRYVIHSTPNVAFRTYINEKYSDIKTITLCHSTLQQVIASIEGKAEAQNDRNMCATLLPHAYHTIDTPPSTLLLGARSCHAGIESTLACISTNCELYVMYAEHWPWFNFLFIYLFICCSYFYLYFLSSGGWVKIKLKLPHFHVSDTCRVNHVISRKTTPVIANPVLESVIGHVYMHVI